MPPAIERKKAKRAHSLSENGEETLDTVVVVENGSERTNHSVDGAGAVGATATPTPPGLREGSLSWTVRCPDSRKSGLVDTDLVNSTTELDNHKARFLRKKSQSMVLMNTLPGLLAQ